MRLEEDIALLERVLKICGAAIWPEPQVDVSVETLRTVEAEVTEIYGKPREYQLIGDEARWLPCAARNVVNCRLDGNSVLVERWTRLAELLAAAIALDLANANKSLGALR